MADFNKVILAGHLTKRRSYVYRYSCIWKTGRNIWPICC